jgi:predicted CXXCH cytochrome family protein
VACHDPHGSPNERLLRQPDDNLCRQCHGLPARHRSVHEGIGVAFGCLECHTAVHGSYDHRSLLDPYLGTNVGDGPGSCWCHNVDN